jgi:HSP20 family protein
MASVTRYDPRVDPFGDLVDDLFKGFLVRPVAYEGNGGRDVLPRVKVDVAEKNGAYKVTAELPGVKKEDIQVSIDGSQVTLAAEVKKEKEASQDERVLHTERVYGKLMRSFTLPRKWTRARSRRNSATACWS